MTAAEFEHLTATQAECLLTQRLRAFLDAGASPSGALVLAAQVEVTEEAAVALLRQGCSPDLTIRLLVRAEAA